MLPQGGTVAGVTELTGLSVQALSVHDEGDPVVVRLPADLEPGTARALAESLSRALGTGKPVQVAADLVERSGTAAVQVLVAASRGTDPRRFRIVAPSETLVETCRVLGLDGWLAGWSRT